MREVGVTRSGIHSLTLCGPVSRVQVANSREYFSNLEYLDLGRYADKQSPAYSR